VLRLSCKHFRWIRMGPAIAEALGRLLFTVAESAALQLAKPSHSPANRPTKRFDGGWHSGGSSPRTILSLRNLK
jgi:hypothetical protein